MISKEAISDDLYGYSIPSATFRPGQKKPEPMAYTDQRWSCWVFYLQGALGEADVGAATTRTRADIRAAVAASEIGRDDV